MVYASVVCAVLSLSVCPSHIALCQDGRLYLSSGIPIMLLFSHHRITLNGSIMYILGYETFKFYQYLTVSWNGNIHSKCQ